MKDSVKIIVSVILAVLLIGSILTYSLYIRTPKQASSGNITVTDSLGRNVSFNSTVTRIVSIDPSATATLYALGAYHDLVGGNAFNCYPPNEKLPNVGDAFSLNLEEIVNLSPQVVLLYSANMPEFAYSLLNLSIPVLVDNPTSISGIENETTMLGILTGNQANASLINSWMNASISDIAQQVSSIDNASQVSGFYYLYEGDCTVGKGTFMNQIMNYAKIKNIAACSNITGYKEMSPSLIAQYNPQVIILDQYVPFSAVTVPPFNETSAYLNNRVVSVVNDSFFQEPDFRVIYGISWLIDQVYPVFVSLPAFPISLDYPPTLGL